VAEDSGLSVITEQLRRRIDDAADLRADNASFRDDIARPDRDGAARLGGDRGNIGEIAAHLGREGSLKVRQERARQRAADLEPIIADLREGGARSFRQLATALNERQVPAARGGTWTAVQVRRVVDQYGR
jgi:hypothetical protein